MSPNGKDLPNKVPSIIMPNFYSFSAVRFTWAASAAADRSILEHGADPGGGVKIGAPLDVVVAKYCVGLAVLFEN